MTDYYFPRAGTISLARKSVRPEYVTWHVTFKAAHADVAFGLVCNTPTRWEGVDSVLSVALTRVRDRIWTESIRVGDGGRLTEALWRHAMALVEGDWREDAAKEYQITKAVFFQRPEPDKLYQPRVHTMADAREHAVRLAEAAREEDPTITTYDVPAWRWGGTEPHIIFRVGKRGGVTTHKAKEKQA